MRVPDAERGGALLTVLLLVAVMATTAATALDRIGVGTRLAANAATAAQARQWLTMTEQLAATRVEDLLSADQAKTLGGPWLGVERRIALPDGAVALAKVEDGGNCFNLNSLVQQREDETLIARPLAAKQFVSLMVLLGIGEGDALRIAASATDYIDSDSNPLRSGGEDGAQAAGGWSANRLMADPSELRLVANVSDQRYRLLERWICALPSAELSPINVNTLHPEQAPLLAMLAPDELDAIRARAQIASRPAAGFDSVLDFWNSPVLVGVEPDQQAAQQIRLRSSFFDLHARIAVGALEISERALIDAREAPARIVSRRIGIGG